MLSDIRNYDCIRNLQFVNIDEHDINDDITAIDMTTAFYDVMFGDSVESGETLNEIEEYVYKRIELISDKEMVLSKYLPGW